MNTEFALISLVRDPSSGNKGDDVTKWKAVLRKILPDQYNVRLVSADAGSKNDPLFRLFDTEQSDTEEDGFKTDEEDEFFNFTDVQISYARMLSSGADRLGSTDLPIFPA